MEACSAASRLAVLIGIALLTTPAYAAVETFSFVSGSYSISGESGPPYADAGITGTFSASVETNGYIELGDLISFEAVVHFNDGIDSVSGPLDLNELTLFSYNTSGGASSLALVGYHSSPNISGRICMGAPAVFDPECGTISKNPIATFSYSWSNPSPTVTSLQVTAYTTVAPTITLVPSTAAPEPSTWALMALGFAGLGLAWRRRRLPEPIVRASTSAAAP